MSIDDYISRINYSSKILSGVTHLVASGLTIDAIRNLYNGITTGNKYYYQMVALEASFSALVELINLSQKIRTREKIDLVKSFERFSESNERLYRKLAEVVDEIEKWLITMEDKPVTKQT